MIQFGNRSQTLFHDHVDKQVRYALPETVEVDKTQGGDPQFFLLRYAGDDATQRGGILRGELRLRYPHPASDDTAPGDMTHGSMDSVRGVETGIRQRSVPFIGGYNRLGLRPFSGDDGQTGRWHAIESMDQHTCTLLAYLDVSETQILHRLVLEGSDVVYMELFLIYQGLVPGIPWLVRADTQRLNEHLQAQLGADPASRDRIVAAFLSLPEDVLTFRFTGDPDDAVDEPAREAMLTEAALHAIDILFAQENRADLMAPPHYRHRSRDSQLAPFLNYSLSNHRREERTHTIGWSISELFARLTPQQRSLLFPTVTKVSPFAQIRVHVINSLPFDANFLNEVIVEVKYIGPRGVFENRRFQFSAGVPQTTQLTTFLPVLTGDLNLQYRITAILSPPRPGDWPVMIQRDFIPCEGVVIDINRQTAGIEFVQVKADEAVFDNAGVIDITLARPGSDATLAATQLTSHQPAVWIALPDVLPGTDLHLTCRVQPPEGIDADPLTLYDGRIEKPELTIHAHQLEVLGPEIITVMLDKDTHLQYPFVAFCITPDRETDDGLLRTLAPGKTKTWRIFRRNIFTPFSYHYRLHAVGRDADGSTLPISVTDWIAASVHHHQINPAFIAAHLAPQ